MVQQRLTATANSIRIATVFGWLFSVILQLQHILSLDYTDMQMQNKYHLITDVWNCQFRNTAIFNAKATSAGCQSAKSCSNNRYVTKRTFGLVICQ